MSFLARIYNRLRPGAYPALVIVPLLLLAFLMLRSPSQIALLQTPPAVSAKRISLWCTEWSRRSVDGSRSRSLATRCGACA